jgi:UTP---glucose-1-phosphate uridylyltransferase
MGLYMSSLLKNDSKALIQYLLKTKNISEKIEILEKNFFVMGFLEKRDSLFRLVDQLDIEKRYAILSVIAIGQRENIFGKTVNENNYQDLEELADKLLEIDTFYDKIGGIIGYHNKVISLLLEKETQSDIAYEKPSFIDIREFDKHIEEKTNIGLKNLDKLGAIFPIGGAGDRLGLIDPITKKSLPTAMLNFFGDSLFLHLIKDLQALEYLHYQTYKKEIIVPIAIMSSEEKNNHDHIIKMLEEKNYFNRPKSSFFVFKQILSPVISNDGKWVAAKPMALSLKPGGHGMLWKLMLDNGVFDWFFQKNIKKAFIRQINNPIACVDYGFLAFLGHGFKEDKSFGFFSCPRKVHSAEGVNILRQKKIGDDVFYGLSNIEYMDFEKWNIKDVPEKKGSDFSAYPSNTNTLFVDLQDVKKAIDDCSLPGMIINMKTKQKLLNGQEKDCGRLELMMQNIADWIWTKNEKEKVSGFLTYNHRKKTISVTKKRYVKDETFFETPASCFYDLMNNSHDLLKNHCDVIIPKLQSEDDFIKSGPSFILKYHPAIGPLYNIISKKISNGIVYKNSDLFLEIADLKLNRFSLNGSLLIDAKSVMGANDGKIGICVLENIKIKNRGIDRSKNNIFWGNKIFREEFFKITLVGHSKFIARDIEFIGNFEISVPDGYVIEAYLEDEIIKFKKYEISCCS